MGSSKIHNFSLRGVSGDEGGIQNLRKFLGPLDCWSPPVVFFSEQKGYLPCVMSPWCSLPRKQKARQKPRKEHDKILESTTKSFLMTPGAWKQKTGSWQLLMLSTTTTSLLLIIIYYWGSHNFDTILIIAILFTLSTMRLQFISCICCFFLAATASTLTLADEIDNSNRSPSLSAEPLRQNEQRNMQLTSVQVAIYPPVALEPTAQKKPEQDSGGERNLFGWNSSRRPSRRPPPRRPTRRPTRRQEMNEIPTLNPTFIPSFIEGLLEGLLEGQTYMTNYLSAKTRLLNVVLRSHVLFNSPVDQDIAALNSEWVLPIDEWLLLFKEFSCVLLFCFYLFFIVLWNDISSLRRLLPKWLFQWRTHLIGSFFTHFLSPSCVC